MEYDKRILRKLQLEELSILKDFIEICETLKLPYFATGGTAIGALRHQGFIPWDDDIDVCMLREDYDKFMAAAPGLLGEKYSFMDAGTHDNYPLMFGKMIKKGTRFVEAAYAQANYPLGIFIDIFPYDKTSEDEAVRASLRKKTWQLGRLRVLTLIPNPALPPQMSKLLKVISLVGCQLVHGLLKLIRYTPEKAYKKYLSLATQEASSSSDLYIDYSYLTGENLTTTTTDMFPLIQVPFEDITISLVREYDKFLRRDYGDYMELPPVEKRHNHYAAYIDFGDEIYEYPIHH